MFLVLAQIRTQHLWIKLLNTWGRYPLVAFFKTTFVFLLPLIQSILLTLCHSDNSKKSSFWKGFFHQNTFLQKSVNCCWDVWLNSYLCLYYTSPIAYFMCQWTFWKLIWRALHWDLKARTETMFSPSFPARVCLIIYLLQVQRYEYNNWNSMIR